MPVSLRSRYARLPVYQAKDKHGTTRATIPIRRRLDGDTVTRLTYTMKAPETIEYLAWQFYKSSQEWWRIADAMPLGFPLDLPPGTRVSVPDVTQAGLIERTRRF